MLMLVALAVFIWFLRRPLHAVAEVSGYYKPVLASA